MHLLLLNSFGATIDIVALVLLTAYALYGLIRGFTKTFFYIFGSLISFMIAILIAPSVVSFLQGKFSIIDSMALNFKDVSTNLLGEELSSVPLSLASSEQLKGIAGYIANIVLSLKDKGNVSPEATIGEAVASIFAYYVILIISIIILFVILKIIFFIIGEIVKKAYANKIVASLDRVLGLALGLINGIFNIELILLIISTIPIPLFQQIIINIESTVLTKFIQSINLYQIIMNNIINSSITSIII